MVSPTTPNDDYSERERVWGKRWREKEGDRVRASEQISEIRGEMEKWRNGKTVSARATFITHVNCEQKPLFVLCSCI